MLPFRLIARLYHAIAILWLRAEVRQVEHDIEAEERRQATHDARIRAWRGHRAALVHRIGKHQGRPQGTVVFTWKARQ